MDREALQCKCKEKYGLKPQKYTKTKLIFHKRRNGKLYFSRSFSDLEGADVEFKRLMGKLEDR